MVDHVKAFGYKVTIPKAIAFVITALLFFWIAPIDQFNVFRSLDFESLFIGAWITGLGFLFVIEGIASTPEAKRGTSKAGALVLIGLGFVSFAFGIVALFGGIDLITGDASMKMITTLLLLGGSILWFVTLVPEVFARTSFVKKLSSY